MEILHKKILLNAVSAALQVIVVGLMYFFLYKFLINRLGPSQLGVWALVISTSSIANFANFGITSGLVKFVADFKEKGKIEQMHKLIFTAFVSIVMFFALLILLGYLFVDLIIHKIIDKQYVNLAMHLLPYSLLCIFINEVGGVYTSILEGFQKNYLRNIIYITSSMVFLGLTYLLVPKYGLMGVTYSQVVQSVLIFISALFTGSSLIKNFSLIKWNWDKVIFKQLISYGSKFQIVSLFQMLYEPATKALLTHFGGLSAVGYYEMASRLVNQARALIVNANQVMIPVVAQASHKGMDEVRKLYVRTMSVTLFINAPLICALIGFSGFISLFWIGHIEAGFIFPLIVLSVAMFFNIMCGPAYYSSLGQGKLNLLVSVHLLMAVLNIILGLTLGYFFRGEGVIVSWGITFAVGSILLIIFYQRDNIIKFIHVFSKSDIFLMLIAMIYAIISLFLDHLFEYTTLMFVLTLSVFIAIFIPVTLLNDNLKIFLRKNN